jgi:hypothetical protein
MDAAESLRAHSLHGFHENFSFTDSFGAHVLRRAERLLSGH